MTDTAPKSWREKLFGGLKRTSEKLGENLGGLFAKPLDAQTLAGLNPNRLWVRKLLKGKAVK